MSLALTYTLYAVLILWGLYVSCSLDSHRARLRELEAKRKPMKSKDMSPPVSVYWHQERKVRTNTTRKATP